MSTIKVSRSQVSSVLSSLAEKGARPLTVVISSVKPLNKKNRQTKEKCPFGESVIKISRMNGILNFNYENAVNSQRKREGAALTFKAAKPAWYESIEQGGKFLKGVVRSKANHSDEYLKLKLEKVLATTYVSATTGKPIEPELLTPYLSESTGGIKQDLNKPIIPLTISLNNLLSFVCDGNRYVIT
jgi:hypothetical protein